MFLIKKTWEGKNKGEGIIGCLKNLPNCPHYVIICDGSGKIPYNYIVDIFQELVSDSNIHCVMSNRKGNKSIELFRYLIERFEIFFICKYLKFIEEVPDGQCGLWGYRAVRINIDGIDEEIKLTAMGYDIELDILTEVLIKKLNFSFIDVKLPELVSNSKPKTLFSYEKNLKKIEFLFTKLDKLKDSIIRYIEQFEKTKEFSDIINSGGVEEKLMEQWEKYKTDLLKLVNNNQIINN